MKKTTIWMQMLGFEKNDPDKGAARYLDHIGFKPDSICGLIFHSDFINYYQGMEAEYPLLQANCAYYGIPRNKERARQDWTNHDLRQLVAALKKQGIGFYAGIMGVYLNDIFHREWLSDNPEVRYMKRDGTRGSMMCLKRMADGTYYEDFFIQKAVQAIVDYDFAGIHDLLVQKDVGVDDPGEDGDEEGRLEDDRDLCSDPVSRPRGLRGGYPAFLPLARLNVRHTQHVFTLYL